MAASGFSGSGGRRPLRFFALFNPGLMDAVDSPPRRIEDVFMGQFVVISIDPVASVADMKDDIATAAASKLPRGKYLALIKAYSVDHSIPYLNHPLSFELIGVGHGLPELPYACIALSPGMIHPEGRCPLLPEAPLPWPDCYLHLLTTFEAIITRLHPAPPARISAIPDTELLTVILARNEAEYRADDEASELEDDGSEEMGNLEPTPAASTASHSSEPSGNRSTDGDKHAAPSSAASRAASSSALSDSRFFWEWPRKLRPRAELWCDLPSMGDFRQPSEILDIMAQLKRCDSPSSPVNIDFASIEDEWAKRAAVELLIDRPRTTQWAKDVANADPPVDNSKGDPMAPFSCIYDDEILPEDAIEHRDEKARSSQYCSATGSLSNARKSSWKGKTSVLIPRMHIGVQRAMDAMGKLADRFSRLFYPAH